jgi:pimeloyl-ACP methyl ester carboxylesterase
MADTIPLILVPGLLCSTDLWAYQVAHLGDVAVPMVTMEHARHDNLPAIAEAILAAAPHRFALAGLSMGGYVALEIMRRAPARISRLALLDTSARADGPEQAARRRELLAQADVGNFKGITSRLLPLLLHPDRLNDRPLVDRVFKMATEIGKDGFLRQQRAIIARPDSLGDLPRVGCPTLVLCGAEDLLTPPERSREIAAAVPGARLRLIEACGHLSTMERPEAVTAALRDWLVDKVGRGGA